MYFSQIFEISKAVMIFDLKAGADEVYNFGGAGRGGRIEFYF